MLSEVEVSLRRQVIENAGQMMNAVGQLGDAKKKVVVLSAIEIGRNRPAFSTSSRRKVVKWQR